MARSIAPAGPPGGDLQPGQAGQRIDHFHRQAFGVVAILARIAQDGEGQHGNGRLAGGRRCLPALPPGHAQGDGRQQRQQPGHAPDRGMGMRRRGVDGPVGGRRHRLRRQARRGRFRPGLLQGSDEAVAQRVLGLDVARMLRTSSRAARSWAMARVSTPGVTWRWPQTWSSSSSRPSSSPGRAQQGQQHGKCLWLQRLGLALAHQGMGRGIDLDGIEAIAPERATVFPGAIAGLHRRFLTPPS